MFRKLKLAFSKPKLAMKVFLNKCAIFRILPDKVYLAVKYRLEMGKKLNLKNPQTFNEKLQWLKIYDRNPEYAKMVDKYEVRKYIEEKIGEEYLIPLLGVWDGFEEIDFESLPEQFVLKCTHDSGGLVICKDKKHFDVNAAKLKIDKCMKRNYFWQNREWPYKNLNHRVIAEQYIEEESGAEIKDYKVHNFNGVPTIVLVCDGRFSKEGLTETFYDVSWNRMEMKRPGIPNKERPHQKPQTLEKMLKLSEILAKNIPFVRIDFYEVKGKLYFGEITFFPASGMKAFIPKKWDIELGKKIHFNVS